MPELKDLIERLEKAEGPSEELGVRILSALLSKQPIVTVEQSMINGAWCAYYEGYDGKPRLWERPSPFREMGNVTASLDAALALVERVRPDLCVENLGEMSPDCGVLAGHWLAQLRPRAPRPRLEAITAEALRRALDGYEPVSAHTPAIALCLALLKSMEQQP